MRIMVENFLKKFLTSCCVRGKIFCLTLVIHISAFGQKNNPHFAGYFSR